MSARRFAQLFIASLKCQRGVAAMEFGIVGLVILALLLPLADVGAAAITYMQVKQAMRNLGAFVQFNPPPDITTPTNWPNLPNNMLGFSVVATSTTSAPPASAPGATKTINITVLCGDPPGAACASADVTNLAAPKYYLITSNVQLNPIVLTTLTGSVLTYVERFQ
jgi:hypothetical protein